MRIFSYILKKDMAFTLLTAAVLTLLSCVLLGIKLNEQSEYEPYYSKTFERLSERSDFYTFVDNEYKRANKAYNDASSEITSFMFSGNYDPYKPPRVIPNELIEKLFVPSDEAGTYTTLAADDINMLSQMSNELKAQKKYRTTAEERLETYSRNARRGLTDEYLLAVSEKLTEDYTEVLETEFEKPADTRSANVLVSYLHSDLIPFLAVFVLLFHRFSSEIQSGRFSQFSLSKFGAYRFTLSKMLSGYSVFLIFYMIYCLCLMGLFFVTGGDKASLYAPLQTIKEYYTSPEAMTVLQYVITVFLSKLALCLVFSGIIMLISLLSRKTLIAGGVSLIVTVLPAAVPKLYNSNECDLEQNKWNIVFSCDCFNMYHDINYINIGGTPVKIYLFYFAAAAFILLLSSAAAVIASGKRGAANV